MSSVPLRSRRELLLQVLRDPERKAITRMAMEYASCWMDKRERPGYYFRHFLYRKPYGSPQNYLGRVEFENIRRRIRHGRPVILLDNKILFHRYYSDVEGVRLPRYLGHSENGVFHGKDGTSQPFWSPVAIERVTRNLLDDVLPPGASSLFVKPAKGSHGRGVVKVTGDTISRIEWSDLVGVDMIVQETVDQHHGLSRIAPDTLNTMRITTYRAQGKGAIVGSAWTRFGRKGMSADNATGGGLFMGVDIKEGVTTGLGQTKFDHGGQLYSHHPDTGRLLTNILIPKFGEAMEMAMAPANAIDYPIVGWDMAISKEGPVLIEGNAGSVYHSDEMANRIGYLAHPVFGPFICDIQREIRRKHRK